MWFCSYGWKCTLSLPFIPTCHHFIFFFKSYCSCWYCVSFHLNFVYSFLMYIELQFFFSFPQAAQYIGEICRYLLNSPPSDADKKHKVGWPPPPLHWILLKSILKRRPLCTQCYEIAAFALMLQWFQFNYQCHLNNLIIKDKSYSKSKKTLRFRTNKLLSPSPRF